MGVQIMKYRATGDCRTPNYKVLGSIAAYEHATAELNLGARSLCIVGGYSGWDWVSIILVEELYDLIVLNLCQHTFTAPATLGEAYPRVPPMSNE
jgi:hypothetical protein